MGSMARTQRIEYEGAVHHVTARGNERRDVFRDDADRESSIVAAGAFTLIELLVVISVIAVLMAVLLPALSRARKQAKAIVCQSRLRYWSMALAVYAEANQGRLPATQGGVDGFWLLRGAFISDQDPNGPQDSFHHFHTKDIACCPAATQPFGYGHFGAGGTGTSFGLSNFGRIEGTSGSAFGAWEITSPAPAFRGSCGLNQYLFESFHKHSVGVGNSGGPLSGACHALRA